MCFILFRVALQFVHDMQERAQRNFDASRDRSLPVFGVGVVFINESTVLPIPSNEMEEAVGVVSEVVSSLATPRKELHIVPIDTAYSSDSDDGKERIAKVVIRREGRMCCSVCECWHCKRFVSGCRCRIVVNYICLKLVNPCLLESEFV